MRRVRLCHGRAPWTLLSLSFRDSCTLPFPPPSFVRYLHPLFIQLFVSLF